jgi:hypothetical protein
MHTSRAPEHGRTHPIAIGVFTLFLAAAGVAARAQAQEAVGAPAARTVHCASQRGERRHCPAVTSGGVALAASHGEATCDVGELSVTTDQDALFAVMGYQFTRRFSLYAGINGLPGTRSVQGSHPYWLGHDRVMAEEFFRPYFGYGIWAQGEVVPGLWYNAQLAVTSSSLGVTASELDRRWSTGASVFWMPTTREFGPRGAFGDWEMHEKVATRFGISSAWSPEERYTDADTGKTGNTTIRLADSLNVFDTGSLAPGVTVSNLDYRLLSFDAGLKYRGFFLQAEYYNRWLDNFEADGPLPVSQIHDTGFYAQAAFFPVPKRLEVYAATSQIFGDEDAGLGDGSEYLVGANLYPLKTRNHRLNVQVIDVNRSPVSSSFGYYIGGQDGTTVSAAFSILF